MQVLKLVTLSLVIFVLIGGGISAAIMYMNRPYTCTCRRDGGCPLEWAEGGLSPYKDKEGENSNDISQQQILSYEERGYVCSR